MFLVYLGEVLKRAFTPTPRLTDGLQIATASAIPALANFAGLEFSQGAQESVLGYIGLVALSFFVIRFFWAPYAMWKEQVAENGRLRLEISKPERLVLEHLAKFRAKHRIKITADLHEIYSCSIAVDGVNRGEQIDTANSALIRARNRAHKAGLSPEFNRALICLHELAVGKRLDEDDLRPIRIFDLILEYLNDRISVEYLIRQSQSYTEEKTQQ